MTSIYGPLENHPSRAVFIPSSNQSLSEETVRKVEALASRISKNRAFPSNSEFQVHLGLWGYSQERIVCYCIPIRYYGVSPSENGAKPYYAFDVVYQGKASAIKENKALSALAEEVFKQILPPCTETTLSFKCMQIE